ncbi:MAG: hypothetical protein JWM39_596 [Parcubacteria group bacterium]|nr:hypothetical protein [Parcubacteria group bacterium]
MEEDILAITARLYESLSELLSHKNSAAPPQLLLKRRPDEILIGKATKEQRAIALLYSQVVLSHDRMHVISGEPFGINPYVDFDHFELHVMRPILFEMLKWSVHRAYPEQKTDLSIRFDDDWNMYAVPKQEPETAS